MYVREIMNGVSIYDLKVFANRGISDLMDLFIISVQTVVWVRLLMTRSLILCKHLNYELNRLINVFFFFSQKHYKNVLKH